VRFCVGHAYLPPGGDPERALEAADAAMYAAKATKQARSRIAAV
jgi:PleD family two-component response regulator